MLNPVDRVPLMTTRSVFIGNRKRESEMSQVHVIVNI